MPPLTPEEIQEELSAKDMIPRYQYIKLVEQNPGLSIMPAHLRKDLPRLKSEVVKIETKPPEIMKIEIIQKQSIDRGKSIKLKSSKKLIEKS